MNEAVANNKYENFPGTFVNILIFSLTCAFIWAADVMVGLDSPAMRLWIYGTVFLWVLVVFWFALSFMGGHSNISFIFPTIFICLWWPIALLYASFRVYLFMVAGGLINMIVVTAIYGYVMFKVVMFFFGVG